MPEDEILFNTFLLHRIEPHYRGLWKLGSGESQLFSYLQVTLAFPYHLIQR